MTTSLSPRVRSSFHALAALSGSVLSRPVLLIALLGSTLLSSVSPAQDQGTNPVATAEARLLEGRFDQAIIILGDHLKDHPRDAHAQRLIARAFYWSGDHAAAGRAYEEALRWDPENEAIRIEAARFFLETGHSDRTLQLLRPLERSNNADALALLGMTRYWKGDWDEALRLFERVLVLDPGNEASRRQINEILAATPSRISVIPEYQTDNQPIRRAGLTARFRTHVTPLSSFTIEAGYSDLAVSDTMFTFVQGTASLQYALPGGLLALDAALGMTKMQTDVRDPEVSFRVGGTYRLSESMTLSAGIGRRPYFETIPSFTVPVDVTVWSLVLDRPESEEWIGRASFQSLRYFDGNIGTSLSAWILIPLRSSPLKIGYAFSLQDTRESRFDTAAATYVPYYTPVNITTHSLLLSLSIPMSADLKLSANGSYGVIASEDVVQSAQGAPMIPGRPKPSQVTGQRSFHPWQFGVSLDAGITPSFRMTLEATRLATAYYQVTIARLTAGYALPVRLR